MDVKEINVRIDQEALRQATHELRRELYCDVDEFIGRLTGRLYGAIRITEGSEYNTVHLWLDPQPETSE